MNAADWLKRLKDAVQARNWLDAGEASDALRALGWTYAQMCEEFGAERWEEIASEIDDAEAAS